MNDGPGFEAALEQLEEAVDSLEQGELGLDAALAKYEQGVRLIRRCRDLLEGAEQGVALLTGVDAAGNPSLAPFDATATVDREAKAEGKPRKRRGASIQADLDAGSPDDGIPY